jgi:hypothetical protein
LEYSSKSQIRWEIEQETDVHSNPAERKYNDGYSDTDVLVFARNAKMKTGKQDSSRERNTRRGANATQKRKYEGDKEIQLMLETVCQDALS